MDSKSSTLLEFSLLFSFVFDDEDRGTTVSWRATQQRNRIGPDGVATVKLDKDDKAVLPSKDRAY